MSKDDLTHLSEIDPIKSLREAGEKKLTDIIATVAKSLPKDCQLKNDENMDDFSVIAQVVFEDTDDIIDMEEICGLCKINCTKYRQ